jgi:hypothetical protein
VSRREEISSEVGGTPEEPFATMVGMAGVSEGETVCGIFQRSGESKIESRYQREISGRKRQRNEALEERGNST